MKNLFKALGLVAAMTFGLGATGSASAGGWHHFWHHAGHHYGHHYHGHHYSHHYHHCRWVKRYNHYTHHWHWVRRCY